MKIVKPSHRIISRISEGGIDELKLIEECARISYRSEDRITEDGESAKKMVKRLIEHEHESCIEHSSMTVIFICDRAIANELERHRLASFTQESTRYVNVKAEKLGADGEMQIILPKYLEEGHKIFEREEVAFKEKVKDPSYVNMGSVYDYALRDRSLAHEDFHKLRNYYIFVSSVEMAEANYTTLTSVVVDKVPPEIARGVLPHSLATKVAVTTNYREWRHIFKLRCEEHAHPDMRDLMIPLLHEVKERIPVVFDDIPY